MAQQTVNIGAAPDDHTGDSLRTGGDKINDNFTELYTEAADHETRIASLEGGGALIDDTATNGDTDKVWSADKAFDEIATEASARAAADSALDTRVDALEAAGAPGSIIDDTAGNGATTKVWSADKSFDTKAAHDAIDADHETRIDALEAAGGGTITSTTGATLGNGSGVIQPGVAGDIYIPEACTIIGVVMLADQVGSLVCDIWKDTYANYPPLVAGSIVGGSPPTITAGNRKSKDVTLTGWSVSVAADTTLRVNVTSCSAITRCHLALIIQR